LEFKPERDPTKNHRYCKHIFGDNYWVSLGKTIKEIWTLEKNLKSQIKMKKHEHTTKLGISLGMNRKRPPSTTNILLLTEGKDET
jgi:hypothetical protein